MKLSFSLPSKSSSKPKVNNGTGPKDSANDEDNRKEFVTEFDPTKTLTDLKPKYVIPPIQNEWRPYKKMKNLDLPFQSDDADSSLQFEVESDIVSDPNSEKMSYGLNLRQGEKNDAVPRGEPRSEPVEQVLLQSLRNDLKRLPEDRGFAEFEEVPVEGFGAALLAGYGWQEGKGIGKNAKEDVKVKEYKKWTGREGLGFDPQPQMPDPKKEDKARERKSDQVKEIDRQDGFSIGKDVRIISGRDLGFKGRIVEKLGDDRFVLRLSKTEEEVKVRVGEIAELGSKEEEKCLKKLKELRIRNEKQSHRRDKDKQISKRSRESERDRRSGSDVKAREKSDREQKKAIKGQVSWLRSHIRVRIISKELKGGRLYLKKGVVVDVVGPTMCDVAMDETRELVQGVDQGLLETALPRKGGPVLVLYGRHKGVYGSLMDKDLDRETGVIRDGDNHEMLNVKLEQIAEYVGDPGDIGY